MVFTMFCKAKSSKKISLFCAAILDHFQTKMFKCDITLFHTFPRGFRISKYIGHLTLGSGGKKTVKRYLKSEQTNKQTDKQTNIWTFQLIESIGPEGRCIKKYPKTFGLPRTPPPLMEETQIKAAFF